MKTLVFILLAVIAADIVIALIFAWYRNRRNEPVNNTNAVPGDSNYTNSRLYTILTAIFIGMTTLLSLALFSMIHDKVTSNMRPYSASWNPKDSVSLKSGPEWFYYDRKLLTINSLHIITEKDKGVLMDLLNKESKDYGSFSQAIDQLAYISNADQGYSNYRWVILLYGMTGVIGVLLRTINNFIGIACFKREFNFGVFWPWYLMRPLIGFITGGVVFLLIDGKLFYSTQVLNGISPVVVALAFIGGFSADDFYIMLRRISQRVFSPGESQSNSAPKNANAKKGGGARK